MQLSLSQLEVLKPINWSPKCRRNTLIGVISIVALGAIVFLSSSQARAWLCFQFMTESLACKKLKIAIENDDPLTAKAILKMFSNSEKIKEYLKSPIDENGNTMLHKAMSMMDSSDEWKEVAKVLLAKPYRLELLQVKNNQGKNPWFYVKYDREAILFLAKMPELSAEVWKTPFDEGRDTVLHNAMVLMGSSVQWKEVAEALLAKPYAAELLRVKDNQEESPWIYVRHNPKAILWMTQMPELSAEVWKTPIDEDGNTVLHRPMSMMSRSDEWKAVAEALLAKPYAAELLQVKNNREESPWIYVRHDPKAILLLAQTTELSADVWKTPIDEDGGTVLHRAMLRINSFDDWKEVAKALLAKPYATELLHVKNNEGRSPWSEAAYRPEKLLPLIEEHDFPVEVWKTPIGENGDTVLHEAMTRMVYNDEWEAVAEALLDKPFAAELLQVQNIRGRNPWSKVALRSEKLLPLIEEHDFPVEVWKIPIDENGDTVLHEAMTNLGSSDKWRAVAEALLAKPFADELKQVKNNAGDVPSDIGN